MFHRFYCREFMDTEFARPANAVDTSVCDREPIHIPGSIQPHGILCVLDMEDRSVLQSSENAGVLMAVPQIEAAGQAYGRVFKPAIVALIEKLKIEDLHDGPLVVGTVLEGQDLYNVIAHVSDGVLIIEFEILQASEAGSLDDLFPQVRSFLTSVEASENLTDLGMRAATHVREITGFDRVLIYRFDIDWNGIVVAEARNDKLPSYLDLRFPASDIPAQARELYRLNRLRLIPDASYVPIPITPINNPRSQAPLDLSLSVLRSVSPVHVQYMQNMGTPASMSISILDNGKLWGLISCHHSSPKFVPAHVRTACDFIGQTLAMQLSSRSRNDAAVQRVAYQAIQTELLASMAGEPSFIDGLQKNPEALLALLEAQGAAIVFNERPTCLGVCPTDEQVMSLVDWLAEYAAHSEIFASDSLSTLVPEAKLFADVASGVVAVPISQIHASYILWFRPEVVQTVTWGGDPTTKIQAGGDPERLHPRRSFEEWKETVRLRSLPWTAVQLDVASAFRNTIVGIVMRKAEELAALNQELVRSNKELEAFSYSVSHDLRAPFRHIVGYAELLKEKYATALDAKAARYINVIVESAESAGKLVDDLLGFSQMGRMTIMPIRIDLNRLVDEVRQLLDTEIGERRVEWKIGNLPTVSGDPGMMRQVMQNLLSNALKYTRSRDITEISIWSEETADEVTVHVRDNGVGFDMTYVGKLFGVFQRLHRAEDYEGTGIGLANVKRIIERHRGRIWAEGELEKGAVFSFSLPRHNGDDQ